MSASSRREAFKVLAILLHTTISAVGELAELPSEHTLDKQKDRMPVSQHLNLVPPLVQAGQLRELLETGQTLKSTLSPANNSLAIYLSNAVRSISRASQLHVILTLNLCRILDFKSRPIPKNNRSILPVPTLPHLLPDAWYV